MLDNRTDLTKFPLAPITRVNSKNEIKDALTAQSLIKFLEKLPPDLPTGFVGHFGVNPYYSLTIRWEHIFNTLWEERKALFLEIMPPNIGPEPD